MKTKKYGIFLIRKNSSVIEGILTSYHSVNLSKDQISVYDSSDDMDKNLMKIKKNFPKLLKKGAKIIPVRLSRNNFPIPIEIKTQLSRRTASFKIVDKVERRKRKLQKLIK
jgi:hypothetical protein